MQAGRGLFMLDEFRISGYEDYEEPQALWYLLSH